jgi:anthranilate phosphoribosyltransferase
MRPLTELVASGAALSRDEIRRACDWLLDGAQPVAARADFLEALHRRGETPAEIEGFVSVLLGRATDFPGGGEGAIDVCGTGGDRAGFFNVSTATMFVAAACGARVVKHGNRGITSKSGGADVLEALGVRVDIPPAQAAASLDSAGCCFLFAPHYHPAFRAVAPVRALLASRGSTSIFNMLGPLLNPARPSFQLAGVFDRALLPTYAKVFGLLGRRRAWAVHGEPSLDEVSPLGPTGVFAWHDGSVREFVIRPEEAGIPTVDARDLAGGSAAENAAMIADIFSGRLRGGARAIVVLNAAAALVVAGIATDIRHGAALAGDALDSGSAAAALDRLRAATQPGQSFREDHIPR